MYSNLIHDFGECEILKGDTFTTLDIGEVELSHSLKSISRYEFLTEDYIIGKLEGEYIDYKLYIQCMANKKIPKEVIDDVVIDKVSNHMKKIGSATTINERDDGSGPKKITSEVIYGLMFGYRIPIECEEWHINRLMLLIRVMSIQQNPDKKKIPINQQLKTQHELNNQRKKMIKGDDT